MIQIGYDINIHPHINQHSSININVCFFCRDSNSIWGCSWPKGVLNLGTGGARVAAHELLYMRTSNNRYRRPVSKNREAPHWKCKLPICDHLSMCKIYPGSRKSFPTRPFQQGTNWTPQGVEHFGPCLRWLHLRWCFLGWKWISPTANWMLDSSGLGGAGALSTSWSKQCSKDRKSVSPSPWSLPFRTLHPQFLNHGIQLHPDICKL